MTADWDAARQLAGAELRAALLATRARLLAWIGDLTDAQWRVPYQAGVNPVAWEAAHVAWFAEFWIRRGPHERRADGLVYAAQPPRAAGPDALLDSARLAHAQRWQVALPSRPQVLAMLAAQMDGTLEALPDGDDDAALYFHRLSLMHEAMHCEAFAWTRAALGYPAPAGVVLGAVPARAPLRFDVVRARIGREREARGFWFDNEQPGAEVDLAPYEIDGAPLAAGRYLDFVQSGGYDRADFWPGAAGRWRAAAAQAHPQRWRCVDGQWQQRVFDDWQPLALDAPVVHINAYEAEAYCRWAGRRLPTAAEWEHAARSAGADFAWGHSVWEWTDDDFLPYAGFAPGPYHDYSVPWFGSHRELRGGAYVTSEIIHHPAYRNYFTPERADLFAGLRTARSL